MARQRDTERRRGRRGRRAAQLGLMVGAAAAAAANAPAAASSSPESVDHALCRLIDASARDHGLPTDFLTRLIWRESSFRTGVVSRAGAQGVAQFMPGTAVERGLSNPFDPGQAIPQAARLLADLRSRFGNLGLAAAAYNGGPARVDAWLSGRGGLPAETRAYVAAITRRSADEWAAPRSGARAETVGKSPATAERPRADAPKPDRPAAGGLDATAPETCLAVVASIRRGTPPAAEVPETATPELAASAGPFAPWGVQVAGNFSKSVALAAYQRTATQYPAILAGTEPMVIGTRLGFRGARPFWRVRVGAPTRAAAESLCTRLQKAGGNCVVLRS